jgi:hypothetical protein
MNIIDGKILRDTEMEKSGDLEYTLSVVMTEKRLTSSYQPLPKH